MIKITFDTNCIINLLDTSSTTAISVDELQEIMRYAMEGAVNIAITTRVDYDLSKDKDKKRKEKLLKQISMFPTIAAGARWDMSTWDSGDFWTDEKHEKLTFEVQNILFPSLAKDDKHYTNKLSDVDHLVSHILEKRNIFVTDDTGILKKAAVLNQKFSLVVLTPKQCLEKISSSQSILPSVTLFREKWELYIAFLTKDLESTQEEISEEDDQTYIQFHDWFKRAFPKIKSKLAQFRLEMNSQDIGHGKFIVDDDVMTNLQYDINPFESFYASSNLKGALDSINDYFYESRSYDKKLKDWTNDRMKAARDLLIEFEGFLE